MTSRLATALAGNSVCLLLMLPGNSSASGAEILGFSYYGANSAYSAPAGAVGGGYFLVDPESTAQYVGYILGSHTYRWNLTTNAAIDNSLTDSTTPMYRPGEYAEGYAQGGGGFLRYSPLGVAPFLNVYTNTGPPVSAGQSLYSFLGRGFRDIAGGDTGSRYTYIASPTTTTFTAQDVFRNSRSFGFGADLREPKVVGGAIYAEFMPHVNMGAYDVPVRLADVARLFGVDHFNWRQTIRVLPASV